MTGYERVLRAVEFRGPYRIPIRKGGDSDMGSAGGKNQEQVIPAPKCFKGE